MRPFPLAAVSLMAALSGFMTAPTAAARPDACTVSEYVLRGDPKTRLFVRRYPVAQPVVSQSYVEIVNDRQKFVYRFMVDRGSGATNTRLISVSGDPARRDWQLPDPDRASTRVLPDIDIFQLDRGLVVVQRPPEPGRQAAPYIFLPDLFNRIWYLNSRDQPGQRIAVKNAMFVKQGC